MIFCPDGFWPVRLARTGNVSIMEYVAPIGQKSQFGKQARDIILPQLDVPAKRPLYC